MFYLEIIKAEQDRRLERRRFWVEVGSAVLVLMMVMAFIYVGLFLGD